MVQGKRERITNLTSAIDYRKQLLYLMSPHLVINVHYGFTILQHLQSITSRTPKVQVK